VLTTTVTGILVTVSLLAGLLSLLFSGLFWARFHVDIPVEDSLILLPLVQSVVETGWSSVSFQEWIAPHSAAHRIAVGRVLTAIEYKYLWGENTLSYLASWLSIGALCYLYSSITRLSKPQYAALGYFMLGMAMIYTCSYTQTRNIISHINSLWYISAACTAFSLYLFVSPKEKLTLLRASGACLFAIIASYSTFLGIIGCLVLVLLAIQSRSKHALWICVLMLTFVMLYMTDIRTMAGMAMETAPQTSAYDILASYIQLLIDFRTLFIDFTVAFLSSPLSESPTLLSYLYVIPSIFLVLYSWGVLAIHWYFGEARSDAPQRFFLAMATVFLGTAIASSLGRAGFNPPTDARYQTIVMLYWLSIGGLLLYSLPGRQTPWIRTACMTLVLLMPVGLLYQQTTFDLLPIVRHSGSANNMELSTRLGVPSFKDPRYPVNIYTPQYIEHESFLSRNTPLSADLPLEIGDIHETPDACHAMRIEVRPLPGSSRHISVVKLIIDGDRFQRYREVRMSGPEDGQGILYATPTGPLTVSKLLWEDTNWKGYYRGKLDSESVTLIFAAVLGPDFRCQLTINS